MKTPMLGEPGPSSKTDEESHWNLPGSALQIELVIPSPPVTVKCLEPQSTCSTKRFCGLQILSRWRLESLFHIKNHHCSTTLTKCFSVHSIPFPALPRFPRHGTASLHLPFAVLQLLLTSLVTQRGFPKSSAGASCFTSSFLCSRKTLFSLV